MFHESPVYVRCISRIVSIAGNAENIYPEKAVHFHRDPEKVYYRQRAAYSPCQAECSQKRDGPLHRIRCTRCTWMCTGGIKCLTILPLIYGYKCASFRPIVQRSGPENAVVFPLFEYVGEPSGYSCHGENWGKQYRADSEQTVDRT